MRRNHKETGIFKERVVVLKQGFDKGLTCVLSQMLSCLSQKDSPGEKLRFVANCQKRLAVPATGSRPRWFAHQKEPRKLRFIFRSLWEVVAAPLSLHDEAVVKTLAVLWLNIVSVVSSAVVKTLAVLSLAVVSYMAVVKNKSVRLLF